jgi:hypothetical protein
LDSLLSATEAATGGVWLYQDDAARQRWRHPDPLFRTVAEASLRHHLPVWFAHRPDFADVAATLGAALLNAQVQDTVWVWNAKCHRPSMIAIRVRLDGTSVYRSSIPICRRKRRFEKGKGAFRFTPTRALVWYGYRSDEGDSTKDVGDTTAANTPFEVDLWQAGGEVDAIDLGVTADAPDGLHMNTIHMLWPGKRSQTTLAPGLLLETWPEGSRAP